MTIANHGNGTPRGLQIYAYERRLSACGSCVKHVPLIKCADPSPPPPTAITIISSFYDFFCTWVSRPIGGQDGTVFNLVCPTLSTVAALANKFQYNFNAHQCSSRRRHRQTYCKA